MLASTPYPPRQAGAVVPIVPELKVSRTTPLTVSNGVNASSYPVLSGDTRASFSGPRSDDYPDATPLDPEGLAEVRINRRFCVFNLSLFAWSRMSLLLLPCCFCLSGVTWLYFAPIAGRCLVIGALRWFRVVWCRYGGGGQCRPGRFRIVPGGS